METDFIKADGDNLPTVDSEMVNQFYMTNTDFLSAEYCNIKTKRSMKESYGDNSIGYVQLKRDDIQCIVKAKITPEHKVRKKAYNVEAIINEKEERVISCNCKDCPASEGACKHGVAFLLWLHQRSEEPSVTSAECYWKKSAFSKIGNSKMDLRSLLGKDLPALPPKDVVYVERVIAEAPISKSGIFDTKKNILLPVFTTNIWNSN